MVFSEELKELARQEKELKDQMWVLITGSSDKSNKITTKELESLSDALGFNLEAREIDAILLWGKYGHRRDFRKIKGEWLDAHSTINTQEDSEHDDGHGNNTTFEAGEGSDRTEKLPLLNIDLGYEEFCGLFYRNERDRKKRISKRLDISSIE